MPSLLGFEVIHISSEEGTNAASTLCKHDALSPGWSSQRFATDPQVNDAKMVFVRLTTVTYQSIFNRAQQELVLAFTDGPVLLHQMQILCHAFKLPAAMEFFVRQSGKEFVRLGHFVPRRQKKSPHARELRTFTVRVRWVTHICILFHGLQVSGSANRPSRGESRGFKIVQLHVVIRKRCSRT